MSRWITNILARIGITVTTTVTPEQVTVIVIDIEQKFIAINRRYRNTRISWAKPTDGDTQQHIEKGPDNA